MPESLAGEFIGTFAGLAICFPLIYQIRSQLSTPTKSPIARYCWWLWALGWLGMAVFFAFVPRAPANKQIMDTPESPRTLGYMGFLACFLCQAAWALDEVSPAANAAFKTKKVLQKLAITVTGTILVCLTLVPLRLYVFKARPFFRIFLAIVGCVAVVGYFGASIMVPLDLSESQIKSGGPEVAGLFWIPVAMQMAALFAAVFTCVLVYTNVEWYGVVLLSLFFAADAFYIATGFFKLYRRRNHYGPIA